jgi:hypothetical protein
MGSGSAIVDSAPSLLLPPAVLRPPTRAAFVLVDDNVSQLNPGSLRTDLWRPSTLSFGTLRTDLFKPLEALHTDAKLTPELQHTGESPYIL